MKLKVVNDYLKSRIMDNFSIKEEDLMSARVLVPVVKPNPVPPYGKRSGFVQRKPENFGDGGSFPEIHVANTLYPWAERAGNPAPISFPPPSTRTPSTRSSSRTRTPPRSSTRNIRKEMEKEIVETMQRTKAALEKIVNVRLSSAQPKKVLTQSSESKFIKYKPSQQSTAFNSGAKERIIGMVEMPVDPLEPPKFKHKRLPKESGSPPVPVMHSPPRPVTVKDQQDWKIPPCISNWKNPKGYTIPLDKRLAADGRGLQEAQINDNFAKISEALYAAEQKAREAVLMRSKVQRELMLKEKDRKEQELLALAQKARSERTGIPLPPTAPVPVNKAVVDVDDDKEGALHEPSPRKETREEREERLQHDKIREERRRERRLEAKDDTMGGKSKTTRDRDRDISEKVALGMANVGAGRKGEVMYDQRLFNQDKGMESGFTTDDQYSIYDKGLFTAHPTLSTLYRPKKDAHTESFKPHKSFSGASERQSGSKRDRPLEFDKQEENDPFGLDQFLTEVKKGKKAMEKIGGKGTMKESAGSSMRDDYDGIVGVVLEDLV